MNQGVTIKSIHPIQPFVIFGILITCSFTFFNPKPITDQNFTSGILFLLFFISTFYLSITKNVITFNNELIHILSSNRLPFSKVKDIQLNWSDIKIIHYNNPWERSSRSINNTLSILFGDSKILKIKTYDYTNSSKKLENLYHQLMSNSSSKINNSSHSSLKKEKKSISNELIIILVLIVVFLVIPIIIVQFSLPENIKHFIMMLAVLGFIASSMIIGLIMLFKNKNSSSEN